MLNKVALQKHEFVKQSSRNKKAIKAAGLTPGEAVVEDGEEDEYGVEAGEDNEQVVEGVPHGVA